MAPVNPLKSLAHNYQVLQKENTRRKHQFLQKNVQ